MSTVRLIRGTIVWEGKILKPTLGNMCLSIKCLLRLCGAEHLRSHPSTKHPYCSKQSAIDLGSMIDSATDRLLPFVPPRLYQWVMILFNMQTKEMLRWKVLPAFRASINVGFGVVDFVLFI